MMSAAATIATIRSCDHWDNIADRLQKSSTEKGHEIFMVLLFFMEDSQGNFADDRNQQAFDQLKWIQNTLNQDATGYFASKFSFTSISISATGHELAERLGVLEEDVPCIHVYSFSKRGVVLKEDRFGLNSDWLRHYLEGLMFSISQQDEQAYETQVQQPPPTPPPQQQQSLPHRHPDYQENDHSAAVVDEGRASGSHAQPWEDDDDDDDEDDDVAVVEEDAKDSGHARANHNENWQSVHTVQRPRTPPIVVNRSTSNSESSAKPVVLVLGHLLLRKLVKLAIEELVKEGATVIINFPMDTAKAHSVKKACLSTTIWTDVLVWSEPFETLSDACRVINKALSVKGRLDAIHIYQSLNCKSFHKAGPQITEFILDGVVSEERGRSDPRRHPSNTVSARLDQIYDSISKERGILDCHQIIYAFLKHIVERQVCESPETRIKIIARPLHRKEASYKNRVPMSLAHLNVLRDGLRSLDISSVDRPSEQCSSSKREMARLAGSVY